MSEGHQVALPPEPPGFWEAWEQETNPDGEGKKEQRHRLRCLCWFEGSVLERFLVFWVTLGGMHPCRAGLRFPKSGYLFI